MNDEQRIKEIRNYQEWLVNNVYVFRYGRTGDGAVYLESTRDGGKVICPECNDPIDQVLELFEPGNV